MWVVEKGSGKGKGGEGFMLEWRIFPLSLIGSINRFLVLNATYSLTNASYVLTSRHRRGAKGCVCKTETIEQTPFSNQGARCHSSVCNRNLPNAVEAGCPLHLLLSPRIEENKKVVYASTVSWSGQDFCGHVSVLDKSLSTKDKPCPRRKRDDVQRFSGSKIYRKR